MLNLSFLIMTYNTHHGWAPLITCPGHCHTGLLRVCGNGSTSLSLHPEHSSLHTTPTLLSHYFWVPFWLLTHGLETLCHCEGLHQCQAAPHCLPVHQRCSPEIPQANTGRGCMGKRDGGQQEGAGHVPTFFQNQPLQGGLRKWRMTLEREHGAWKFHRPDRDIEVVWSGTHPSSHPLRCSVSTK